ncbi:hypothetical protein EO98_08510 [Methanosarcina sp. 2.H.T.1A.6]|nr:hypothetical protein EO94_10365 [Methanosarcina sp. 2.H.T.1A.3]KKG15472.1 hypothetical protein EO97_11825 [Methanosarcina sp. 2.H.T.1A.15]KKG20129.1 hypothetical protein EO98_08510 [Methanosarcina sp. 2.H.T.1A.6]KKG23547.1 hypothetical protein EO96_08570 [Methanosarcina sp. 2.H.T.1A.8]
MFFDKGIKPLRKEINIFNFALNLLAGNKAKGNIKIVVKSRNLCRTAKPNSSPLQLDFVVL